MSIHISAAPGSIARTVLMPGDPLRAKIIAEKYLQSPQLVNQTRNVLMYTGAYNGVPVTIAASGMGCPSIGIYSYELYTEFEVENILRIGTCGAYTTDLKLFDLINVSKSASESTFALHAWGIEGEVLSPSSNIYNLINLVAKQGGPGHAAKAGLHQAAVHCSDIFYRKSMDLPEVAARHNCVAVEMESFALFANAQYLGKQAACLLTVSDVIPTHEKISADQREQSLHPMIELALETARHL
jgi:purine-nucleoside phosphorylase